MQVLFRLTILALALVFICHGKSIGEIPLDENMIDSTTATTFLGSKPSDFDNAPDNIRQTREFPEIGEQYENIREHNYRVALMNAINRPGTGTSVAGSASVVSVAGSDNVVPVAGSPNVLPASNGVQYIYYKV